MVTKPKRRTKEQASKVMIAGGVIAVIMLSILCAGCIETNMSLTFYVDDKIWEQKVFDGKTLTFPENPPDKAGYTFMGWYFDKGTWEKSLSLNTMKELSLAKDLNVYAYYKPDSDSKYRVKFVTGTTAVPDAKIYASGLIQMPTNPTRVNYYFQGWYRSQNCYDSEEWDFNRDHVQDYSDENGVVTLYAKWGSYFKAKDAAEGYAVKTAGYPKISEIIYPSPSTPDKYGKVYVQYVLGTVDGAYIATIADTGGYLYTGGYAELAISNEQTFAKSVEDGLKTIAAETFGLSNSNTLSVGSTQGAEITVGASTSATASVNIPLVSASATASASVEESARLEVREEVAFTSGINYQSSKETQKSLSETNSYTTGSTYSLKQNLEGQQEGYYYRVALRQPCLVAETIEYDTETGKATVYGSVHIATNANPNYRLECSDDGLFSLPEETEKHYVDPSDLSYIYGNKKNGCYVIDSVEDLLLVAISKKGDKFILESNIDLKDYPWFDWKNYENQIELNGYTITPEEDVIPVINPEPTPVSQVPTPVATLVEAYEISSADDFMKIYNRPSLQYKLVADIDLTGYSIPEDVIFKGTLDGNWHTITGSTDGSYSIHLDSTKYGSTKYFGLFSVNSGTIMNLKLQNFGIDGGDQDYAGISDSRQYAYFGSVAGLNEGTISEVYLSNCKVKDMRMWGGCGLLVGQNKGAISSCYINGGSLAGDCDVGGVAGVNEGTIHSCSVHDSSISFTENSWVIFTGYNGRSIGGIVGYASSSSSLIDSCSVSDITISSDLRVDACYIGSIAGSNYGKLSGCTAAGVSPSMNKCGMNKGTEI